MPEPLFDLFFSGQIMEGQAPEQVRLNIARLFKASDEQLSQLFSGKPVKIKSGIKQESAGQYQAAFRKAGALLDIKPCDNAATSNLTSGSEAMTLLPPNTGSLIDCAAEKHPAPLPDISDMTLAAAGSDIDLTPAPAASEIDTSDLSLNPPNSGSLEDVYVEPEPAPLPDISTLELDEPEEK